MALALNVPRNVLRWVQILAGAALVVLALTPVSWVQAGPSLCLVKAITGHECYGCGMTRALASLLHGDVAAAMNYNRGSAAVLPLLMAIALSAIFTHKDPVQAAEARTALRFSWFIVSALACLVLLTPWVLTPERIASLTPRCEWKARYHRECFLCGMTTAFIDIRNGRFGEAERANTGSLPLFAGMLLNQAGLLLFLRKRKKC